MARTHPRSHAVMVAAFVALAALLTSTQLAIGATSRAEAAQARQPDRDQTRASRPRLSWPLDPAPRVTRAFDAPEDRYGSGHRGVDLAATPGQQVLAADAGVVVFAGMLAGRGVISIQHDGGIRSTYEPVRPSVAEGARVYRGQAIGTVRAGHPGCTARACLHWGVRRDKHHYLDPLTLVRTYPAGRPIRLKPWDGGNSNSP